MAQSLAFDFVRTEQPDGRIHFHLPEHDEVRLALILVPIIAVFSLLGIAWQGFLVIAIPLFFFLIFAPISFRGGVEILITDKELESIREVTPLFS